MTRTTIKTKLNELAVQGAPPAFQEHLCVGRPNQFDRERLLERINGILDRNWLTNNGPLVREFESRIAEFLGVRHCIAMSNGTLALEIAIRATGMTGEVIVPAFTFVATPHSLKWQGITPVFCDVDPESMTVDPERLERLVTSRTTGIMGVHLWGRPCNVEALERIARKYNLTLIFDAAHAFGCSWKGKMIGGFGRAEVFSFHATKFFHSFEGGAVVTNDDELAARMRLMKNFGFAGYDNVIELGINGKMSEVNAAMGLTGLESLDEIVEINQRNYRHYVNELQGTKGIFPIMYDEAERSNYQYIVLEIDEGISGLSRDRLVEILHAENVIARRYFYPGCHQMEPYRSLYPHYPALLPNTERLVRQVMQLPTGTVIGENEISIICSIIRTAVENAALLARPEVPGK